MGKTMAMGRDVQPFSSFYMEPVSPLLPFRAQIAHCIFVTLALTLLEDLLFS